MSCAYDKERLTGYFDGELEAAEKADVEKHISACSECLRDLGEVKAAAQLVKALPRPRAPRSIADGVSREIAASGRVHSMAKYRRGILWTFAAAAAFLIVANISYFTGREAAPKGDEVARSAPMAPKIGVVQPTAPRNGAVEEQSLRRGQADEAGKLGKAEQPAPAEYRKKLDSLVEEKAKSEGAKEAGTRDDNRARAAAPAAAPVPSAKPAAPPPAPAAKAPAAEPAEKKAGEALAKREELEKAAAPPPAAPKPVESKDRAPLPLERQLAEAPQLKKQQDADGAAAAQAWTVAGNSATAVRAKAEEILASKGWGAPAAANAQGRQENKLAAKANDPKAASPLTLELTAAQFAELKRLLEAQSGVRLTAGGPGEAQLAQAGRGIAGGGGATKGYAPEPKPAAQQQAPAPGVDAKKSDPAAPLREGRDSENAEKLKDAAPADKAQTGGFGQRNDETRRTFVLYFLEAPAAEKK